MTRPQTLQQLYASKQDVFAGWDSLEDVAQILLDVLNKLEFDFDNLSRCKKCESLIVNGVPFCKDCTEFPGEEKTTNHG